MIRTNGLEIIEGMAGTTGLEPATSDVTGRRSNQLNYVPERVKYVGNSILTRALELQLEQPGLLAQNHGRAPFAPSAQQREVQTQPDRPLISPKHQSGIAFDLFSVALRLGFQKVFEIAALV